jgi:hypothetical protein
MNAVLTVGADNLSLSQGIERAAKEAGLELTIMAENDSNNYLWQPKARQAVRSARIFIAGITKQNFSNILYEIGIAKSGQVPIVIVNDNAIPLDLQGPILGDIPKENVFSLTPTGFLPGLEARLRELASAPRVVDGAPLNERPQTWFLNYSGGDQTYADDLLEFFARYNVPCWNYDHHKYETNIRFVDEIDKAIRGSSGIVGIVTPNWRSSQRAQDEFIFAKQLGKQLFLLADSSSQRIIE